MEIVDTEQIKHSTGTGKKKKSGASAKGHRQQIGVSTNRNGINLLLSVVYDSSEFLPWRTIHQKYRNSKLDVLRWSCFMSTSSVKYC